MPGEGLYYFVKSDVITNYVYHAHLARGNLQRGHANKPREEGVVSVAWDKTMLQTSGVPTRESEASRVLKDPPESIGTSRSSGCGPLQEVNNLPCEWVTCMNGCW